MMTHTPTTHRNFTPHLIEINIMFEIVYDDTKCVYHLHEKARKIITNGK